ncbi:MAG: ABC transporter substrate-binding protein [Chloroflexi bacterium]|nr:ABC transporter substrate-binding protein [Chloroflexota bacterium]
MLHSKLGVTLLLVSMAALLMSFAVACGGPAEDPAPAAAQPTAAPAATAVPAAGAQPTEAPAAAMTEETGGKVTLMNAVWATELFTPRDGVGETATYGRQMHAFWINGNANLEMVPGVLTDWTVSEDGLSWDLTLRDGITFHNGDPLTIDDAMFTMEFTFGPEAVTESISPSVQAEAAETASIEATGPNTLRVTHTTPKAFFPFFISDLSFGIAGILLPKTYFESLGQSGYNDAPIGAGPFRLEDHVISEQILLERYEDYFDPERGPSFQTLDMRLVPEVATRVAALRAGDADVIEANLSVKDQVEDGGARFIWAQESSYMWILLPGCWEVEFPCNKKEVRQALDYAIDKDLIINSLYGPEAAVSRGWNWATPNALGYSEDLDPFPYDPEKAQQLMVDAGYPNGEGFGTLEVHTWKAGDVPFLPEQAQLIADMWRKNLGIDVDVIVGEAATVRERWFDRQLDGKVIIRANETRWDGGSITNAIYGDPEGGGHLGGRRDDLIAVAKEALSVVDPTLRQDAFNKAYKILREEHYEFGTGYVNLPWGVGPRIASWDPWPVVAYQTAIWTMKLN